jgi:rod shape determining protein RodA
MSTRRKNISAHIDWTLLGLFALLAAIGWLNLVSAATGPDTAVHWSLNSMHGRQLIWLGLSTVITLLILKIEGEFFIRTTWINYALTTALLAAVLVVGHKVGGARSWFGFGGFGIQPSEFAKFGAAMALAWWLAFTKGLHDLKSIIGSLAIIGLPVGLILLQPDAGTVLIFVGFIFALYREGMSGFVLVAAFTALVMLVFTIITGATTVNYPWIGPWSGILRFLLATGAVFTAGIFLGRSMTRPRHRRKLTRNLILWAVAALAFSAVLHTTMAEVLPPHQRERIHVLFGIEVDNPGANYNIRHARIAIGSGGLTGRGWCEGPMTGFGFVPEQETDFIFCKWSEEWGFVGSAMLVLLFAALIIRIFFIAERQRSAFTRIYAYNLGGLFFMHLLINVGMVLGLAPVIGIPLPMMSYGGSSVLAFSIMMAVLLRLDAERFSVLR